VESVKGRFHSETEFIFAGCSLQDTISISCVTTNIFSDQDTIQIYFFLSIVSDFRLVDRISIIGRGEVFFPLTSDQTSFEARPVFGLMGTRGPFPGVKRGRGVTLTTHTHLVPMWMSRSYTSCPPSASMVCSGTALL